MSYPSNYSFNRYLLFTVRPSDLGFVHETGMDLALRELIVKLVGETVIK